ncbi:MAG: hypothetical protein LBV50_10620 [Novosphingobium sp.]|jgi:uncharacterized protein (UPF0335 family)|nr:hypothetical protein [Novosphingobium sp.]
MSENIENLILEHLKRFQSGQERIERELKEIKTRVGNIEAGQATVIQHLGHLAAADATQQLGIDNLNDRVERIERRLEING